MARKWIVASLMFVQAGLLGWMDWAMCPNKTEVGHMGATAYFWHTLRFDVFCVNPPLTRMITGVPVVMLQPNYNWDCYSSRPQDRSEWPIGNAFISANSREKNWWCFTLARWSLIPFLLLSGFFGYRLSRAIYGNTAGIVCLTLWCFSPLLLAWGATICPDATAAALGVVALYTFRQWLHKPTWMQAAIAGVCLGLLPLTKLTWIIAFGIWPLIWFLWTVPIYAAKAETRSLPIPPLRQLAVILLLALYTLNMGYLFDGTFRPLGSYEFNSRMFCGDEISETQHPATDNRFRGTFLVAIPVPVPADFVQGIDTQRLDFEHGLPSYLRGQWADHGWWYYYLYALVVKVPLGTWGLVAMALGVTVFDVWKKRPSPPAPLPEGEERSFSASWRDEMVVLAPGLVILIFVSSQTGFSVHSRYVIPALPFLFVWTSKVARVFEMRPFTKKRLAMATIVVLALIWSVGSSLAVYPHSLSYFNELAVILPTPADASYPKPMGMSNENRSVLSAIISAGPRNGPRHLLDSNIDWGQDLFYLKDWLDANPDVKLDGLAYYGSYPAALAGIPETPMPATGLEYERFDPNQSQDQLGPKPGWYALSVNYIYGRSQQYRYFLHIEPIATAGYSIYIYHITLDEANRVRKELGLPELRAEGGKRKVEEGGQHG